MRIVVVLSSVVVLAAVFGYAADRWRHSTESRPTQTRPKQESGADAEARHARAPEVFGHLARMDGHTEDRLSQLDERLKSIEAEREATQAAQAASANEKPAMTHAELGTWITEKLDAEPSDPERKARAEQQIAAGLGRVPGARLDSIDCGRRFCKAVFAQGAGTAPDIEPLIGLPPFDNGLFSTPDPDGGVLTVYMPAAGETVAGLYDEAAREVGESLE